MKSFFLGLTTGLVAIGAVGSGVILAGKVDVAADSPHLPITYQILNTARKQAIARNASDIQVPNNLGDSERIIRGAGNYEAMCADCHLKPGTDESEIRMGLYPVPPDLNMATPDSKPAERFWVIKHGIKGSGMAAWGKGGMSDDNIWDLVALIESLPAMNADEYSIKVASSGGHSHGGGAGNMPHDGTSERHEPSHTGELSEPIVASKLTKGHKHPEGSADHHH